MRTRLIFVALVAGLMVASAGYAVAKSGGETIKDGKRDERALKNKPEIDIVKVSVSNASGNRVKYKIKMRGRLTPGKANTRPFILINTKGNNASDFEYLALGPRLLKKTRNDKFRKVGANQFVDRKRTWIYRFKPRKIGIKKSFGWAALTAKGKATDLAPNARYTTHKI